MTFTSMYNVARNTYACLSALSVLPFNDLRSIPAVHPSRSSSANRSAALARALWHAGTEGKLERMASLSRVWPMRDRGDEHATCFSVTQGTSDQLWSLCDRLEFLTKSKVTRTQVVHLSIWIAYFDEIVAYEDRAHMRVPSFDSWYAIVQQLEQHAQRPLAAKVWGR